MLNADSYEPGDDGFLVAHWVDPKASLKLELTNSCLVGQSLVVQAAIP